MSYQTCYVSYRQTYQLHGINSVLYVVGNINDRENVVLCRDTFEIVASWKTIRYCLLMC